MIASKFVQNIAKRGKKSIKRMRKTEIQFIAKAKKA
ncbi:hypothetical protein Thit_1134 [Thermoanaerobacter italicus Ab9]|jgi:hypothetical protein|uniref:Uncharacterized protein n=3 Tax=Thermoanaerobacter TaxID=1754 RepID=D3T6U6_THEIA|nr:hypothetical protein Thit_0402 [Thermoanaerobacter italicus Ab9]ADD01903.1 hypothetical protein Thit_0602 [Thermoanaerobacter italicus Ab9]ADD02401.1 hypothetical protein Thit_1134 [Thermoanaerobacter italicus Ab9]ADV78870.1 hypothetical protein Thebr_0246 [Thermoanaerobacter brockii subsp. finnii Ako-1]MDP9751462.1 hypothetical protein [Thermoanaerobacter pentosaceus]